METCDLGIPYLGLGQGLGLGIRSRVRVRARANVRVKPLSHYAGNLLATWWQKMVAGDCHHIFTTIIFY